MMRQHLILVIVLMAAAASFASHVSDSTAEARLCQEVSRRTSPGSIQ